MQQRLKSLNDAVSVPKLKIRKGVPVRPRYYQGTFQKEEMSKIVSGSGQIEFMIIEEN